MLHAKYIYPKNGTASDQKHAKKYLSTGGLYKVERVNIGGSFTDIYLTGVKTPFNSVQFEFYENGKKIDIYKDPRFSPYIKNDIKEEQPEEAKKGEDSVYEN